MAPFLSRASSKADRGEEELLLELEALNQALQSRSHTRSNRLASFAASPLRPSESKSSCSKRPLQPRPSFKVPFRSTSISCDRPRRFLSSNSTKQSEHHRLHARKLGTIVHAHRKKKDNPQLHSDEAREHLKHYEDGLQQQQNEGVVEEQSRKRGQQQDENKGSHHDQLHLRKTLWSWRPLRAFSHMLLGSHSRLNALFSLQVHRIESLPAPMNGLSLMVVWIRKHHYLQATPSRVVDGIAVFGETLQYQCTIFSTHSSKNIIRYDAKPCTLSIMTTGLNNLELAKHHVDLSSLLPEGDLITSRPWDSSHDATYELLGMAKGGALIVTFHCNLVQKSSLKTYRDNQFAQKRTTPLTKSLPFLQGGAPLLDAKKALSSPLLSEPGAAVDHCHSMGHLDDSRWNALKETIIRDEANQAAGLNGDDDSNSFEFKPPLKPNHLVEFSFSHRNHLTSDDSIPHDEGFPALSRTFRAYEDFIVEGERRKGTHELTGQLKSQKLCYSRQSLAPARSLSLEVARCLGDSKTDTDDDLDSKWSKGLDHIWCLVYAGAIFKASCIGYYGLRGDQQDSAAPLSWSVIRASNSSTRLPRSLCISCLKLSEILASTFFLTTCIIEQ
ncbi:hypothetical protein GOP47_0025900 [Adiantum capillus-veneris]|uniref:C2 NT-type domain-containing protein n=1 Tax=Adiantum capillus-veneris TaxID=13818 RepID=A0A9D4U3P0_ADICA|nr:hypothetical protein GOP47_0025900 [Adiantum capillus-veneris]